MRAQKDFTEVVEIRLISDSEIVDNQLVEKRDATKGNIRTVLELLAGKTPSAERIKLLENAVGSEVLQKTLPSKPNDMVLIAFSSHGYANKNGVFYIVPTDISQQSTKKVTDDLLSRSISSDELSLWLREVDAGELVMVLDACQSAAAVEGGDFKPGPMGSRGLGQLSYDKGMRILTATQSDNVAWEYPSLKQGILTYALLRDGLEARQADYNHDNTITLSEWLSYGVKRVPKLYQEVLTNSLNTFGLPARTQPKPVVADGQHGTTNSRKELLEVLIGNPKSHAIQQPSLFDFTKKKREIIVVSRF